MSQQQQFQQAPPQGQQYASQTTELKQDDIAGTALYWINKQPQASRPMNPQDLAGRNPLNKPFDEAGKRDWSHGLFDCLADPLKFVMSWCCACMQYQDASVRLRALQAGRPAPEQELVGLECLAFWASSCVCAHGFLAAMHRSHVREYTGIQGDLVNDLVTSYICCCCGQVQTAREIEELEHASQGHKH